MTPAGIEPGTFEFVKERLNHCATAVSCVSLDIFLIVYILVENTDRRMYMWADNSLGRPGMKQATFPAFYGTWRFITTFTTVHHLSLP